MYMRVHTFYYFFNTYHFFCKHQLPNQRTMFCYFNNVERRDDQLAHPEPESDDNNNDNQSRAKMAQNLNNVIASLLIIVFLTVTILYILDKLEIIFRDAKMNQTILFILLFIIIVSFPVNVLQIRLIDNKEFFPLLSAVATTVSVFGIIYPTYSLIGVMCMICIIFIGILIKKSREP